MGDVIKVDAVVIGAGQAGLASAYELTRRGVSHVVLEAGSQVGDQWRNRWDSLRLFTPARFDGLPGSKFPAPPDSFDGKFFWFYANKIASVRTPIGRRMKPFVLHHGAPLIRVTMREALAAGVERAPRITSVDGGAPVGDGGRRLQPQTIVWCTGFTRGYSWLRFLVGGDDG